jgi:hypothetical protein
MNDLDRAIYLRLIGWKEGDQVLTDEQTQDAYDSFIVSKQAAKVALLNKLGITADEATLLLG